jgi:hypothetical protein
VVATLDRGESVDYTAVGGVATAAVRGSANRRRPTTIPPAPEESCVSSPADVPVVHLLTRQSDSKQVARLTRVVAEVGGAQRVVALGRDVPALPPRIRAIHAHVPVAAAPLRQAALARAVRRAIGGTPDVRIWHAWDVAAARWCGGLISSARPLIVERRIDDGLEPVGLRCRQVCPSDVVQALLTRDGLPHRLCPVIRPAVEPPGDRAPRAELRRALGLDDDAIVVSALPTARGDRGLFVAAWAVMLLQKVRSDLRLVLPSWGARANRARRLVQACEHGWMAQCVNDTWTAADLLRVADVVAVLPTRAVTAETMAAAAVAGRPLLVSDVPAVRGWLPDPGAAWLCRPGDAQDAARMLLRAIENPPDAATRATRLSQHWADALDPQQFVAAYHALYATCAADARAELTARTGNRTAPAS